MKKAEKLAKRAEKEKSFMKKEDTKSVQPMKQKKRKKVQVTEL